MIDAFFSALSGMRTASTRLANSANNTANVSTPGFKKSQVVASEVRSGGSQVQATVRSGAQGAIVQTGNPFDVAIAGAGFFQVARPSGGLAFTRAGRFSVDGTGRLVDANGNPLQPEIAVPGNVTGIGIGSDGQVTAQVNGVSQTLGQIQLARFNNPAGLTPLGNNQFAASSASGQPLVGTPGTGGLGQLVPGAFETSNVDITEEAVQQILAKTAFRANANVIRAADEMTGSLLDIKA